jgi:membrane protease YdiL (CAAX protease family)
LRILPTEHDGDKAEARGVLARTLARTLGGALWGVAAFYLLSVWIEPLIERFIPVPPAERAQLLRLLRPQEGLRPLWQDVLCFALAPAVCEEVLFRGAILSLLGAPLVDRARARARARADAKGVTLRATPAVLSCALLFGIFHLSTSKLVPTTLLGIGFGAAAVLGRSLWPAIAMHCVNNALVVLLVRRGMEEAPASWRNLLHFSDGGRLLAGALVAALAGYVLLCRNSASRDMRAPG